METADMSPGFWLLSLMMVGTAEDPVEATTGGGGVSIVRVEGEVDTTGTKAEEAAARGSILRPVGTRSLIFSLTFCCHIVKEEKVSLLCFCECAP